MHYSSNVNQFKIIVTVIIFSNISDFLPLLQLKAYNGEDPLSIYSILKTFDYQIPRSTQQFFTGHLKVIKITCLSQTHSRLKQLSCKLQILQLIFITRKCTLREMSLSLAYQTIMILHPFTEFMLMKELRNLIQSKVGASSMTYIQVIFILRARIRIRLVCSIFAKIVIHAQGDFSQITPHLYSGPNYILDLGMGDFQTKNYIQLDQQSFSLSLREIILSFNG
ncbi:hypothetical protein FGO68_gene9272 [Halteria grandinella]|uniref:Uncharacterized protein n=1 Tax=Halteria grandinella TaxID=5974 RepID=A0A8J8P747_HALGN|nr:hypothetical protein FGO68_gene9272 [Halteria grandinella]